jgi:hypothetical protein
VVPEDLLAAAEQAVGGAGIDADATGSAALAGVMAMRAQLASHERVVVPVTGARHRRTSSR